MTHPRAATVVLALGNDILGDDAVGLAAARRLGEETWDGADVVEVAGAGLDLLEHLEGRRRALLLDAVLTGDVPAGTVQEFSLEALGRTAARSPHAAGLPDVFEVARRLAIPFPAEVRILAMEVEDLFRVRQGLTPAVEAALPAFVERARRILRAWSGEEAPAAAHAYAASSAAVPTRV